MDVDTDALRWFQQVADGTTVTEVSELDAVAQSGVSRALARLEAQIGTPLLRRSGRILRLTHAGSVFKRHVDAMLHQFDDGIAAVNQLLEPAPARARRGGPPPETATRRPRDQSVHRRSIGVDPRSWAWPPNLKLAGGSR